MNRVRNGSAVTPVGASGMPDELKSGSCEGEPSNGAKRLTSRAYWNSLPIPEASRAPARSGKRWIPARWRQVYREIRSVHAQRILHRVLLPPLLAEMRGGRFLEIGSAPGYNGLDFQRNYGLEPYGLEYSEPRAMAQRKLYRQHQLPEEWVIQGDFFDDRLLSPLRESFDVVASFGFIEHFEHPAQVIARHLEYLRPGGVLLVGVPNLGVGSVNGWLARRFNPAVYALHNIETCTAAGFRRLYPPPGCDPVFCGPLGGVHLEVLPDERQQSRLTAWSLAKAWPIINAMNHIFIGNRLVSFPRSSSSWLMIAHKRAARPSRPPSKESPS